MCRCLLLPSYSLLFWNFHSDKLANCVHYIYLIKLEVRHLLHCIRGLRDNKDSNCHGLRFPLITSLTIGYYPHDADTLHTIKRVLPDLKRIHVTLRINNWNQFNGLGSLSKAIKQHKIVLDQMLLNLKIYVHLDIKLNIDRCRIEGKRISPYIGEINRVSLRHIRLTGVCNDNNFTQHLCKSV